MPDHPRTLEVKLGVVGLIILGLSLPVILYMQMGLKWAFITMGILAAAGVLVALLVVLRRGRRIDDQVRILQAEQTARQREIFESWGRARELAQGSGMTTVEAFDMLRRVSQRAEEGETTRFAPGVIKGEIKLQRIKPSPKPDPPPPTAWERIISADSEDSDEPG